jgi:hypothetical protein
VAVSTVGLESARAGHVADETRSTNRAMCAASRTPALRDTSPSVPRPPAVPEKHALTAPESFVIPPQSKMLKCADNEDIITMKADDAGDVVTFMFESPGTSSDRAPHLARDAGPRTRPKISPPYASVFQTPPRTSCQCALSRFRRNRAKVGTRRNDENRPASRVASRGADRRGTHPLTPC